MAKLYFEYSTMNSGKSAMLVMQAHQFDERDIPVLCLKSSIDTRDGDDVIASRMGVSRPCVSILPEDDLYQLIEQYIVNATLEGLRKPLWILVDECQFLTIEQVDSLAKVVDKLDINVLCYGLRTDFTTHLFDGSKRLMEVADTITEIKSSCSCGRKAMFNARFDSSGRLITDGEQIVIGGNDMYVTLCRNCYYELLKKQKMQDKEKLLN